MSPIDITYTMPNTIPVSIPRVATTIIILFPIVEARIGYITSNTIVEIINIIRPTYHSIITNMYI